MKITHTYKGSWFVFAMVAFVIVGQVAAWAISDWFGLTNSPIMVGVLCAGLALVCVDAWFDDSRER